MASKYASKDLVNNWRLMKNSSIVLQRRIKKQRTLFHLLPDDVINNLLTYFIWKDTSALALTNRFWSIRIRNAKKVFPEWKTTSFTVSNAANLLQLLESNYLGYANTRYSPQYLLLHVTRDMHVYIDASRTTSWRSYWHSVIIALLHDQNIPRIGCGIICTQTHKRSRVSEWDITIAVAQFPDTQIDYILYDRRHMQYESRLSISSYPSVITGKKQYSEQPNTCSKPSFQLFSTNTNAAARVLESISQWHFDENINQTPNVVGSILQGSDYEKFMIATLKPQSYKGIMQKGAIKMHTFATTAGDMQAVSNVVPFAFEERRGGIITEENFFNFFLNYRNISLNAEGTEWFDTDALFDQDDISPKIRFFASSEISQLENLRNQLDTCSCSSLIPSEYANVHDHTPITIHLNQNRLTLQNCRELEDEERQKYGFFARSMGSLHSIDSILTRQFDSMNTLTPHNHVLLGSMIWTNHEIDYEHRTNSYLHWNTSQNIGPSLFYCPSTMHRSHCIPSTVQDDIICGAFWYKTIE